MVGSRALLSAATVLVVGASSYGATVTYSNTAPTLGVDGVSNVVGGTTVASNVTEAYSEFGVNHYVAGDNAAKGQTFTTGTGSAGGYRLTSITLKTPGYAATDASYFNLDGTGTIDYRLRVSQPDSGDTTLLAGINLTVLASETATTATGDTIAGGSSGYFGGPNKYVTFTLSTPITLAAGTLYAFDVGSTGIYSSTGDFFESLGTNNQAAYAGGTAYITGNNGIAINTGAVSTGDRVFYANLTAVAVPEPTSLALAGVAAVGLLRRRRA